MGLRLALVCLLLLAGHRGGDMAVITYQLITPDGVTFNIETGVFRIFGLENIGMPGLRTYSHQVPGQSGAVLDDMLDR